MYWGYTAVTDYLPTFRHDGGPSGTGTIHFAVGPGLAACQKGLTTAFVTAAALLQA
jgi:hypothetical protein